MNAESKIKDLCKDYEKNGALLNISDCCLSLGPTYDLWNSNDMAN